MSQGEEEEEEEEEFVCQLNEQVDHWKNNDTCMREHTVSMDDVFSEPLCPGWNNPIIPAFVEMIFVE